MALLLCFVQLMLFACINGMPNKSDYIVGGVEVNIKDYPFIIGLLRDNTFICGGSILNEYWVMTAFHCVESGYSDKYSVRTGSSVGSEGGVIYHVDKIIKHKREHENLHSDDIALLKLKTPIKFNENTSKIAVASSDFPINAGDIATLIGYGTTEEGTPILDHKLRMAQAPIVDHETCKKQNQYVSEVDETMICAALPEGGKDTCQGDSGGPLILNNVAAGIVSFGSGCARPGYPGVYTNVPYFSKWIMDQMTEKNE